MKVAILFSGQLRGFKHIVNNLNDNLIKNFENVDTYFYVPKNDYSIEEYFKPTSIIYDDDVIHDTSNIFNFKGHQNSTPQNFIQQWYSLYKCKELMLENNIKYDLIIRCRPDNDFISPLTLDMIDINKINICEWGGWEGYNDRFAIGNFDDMLIYCDFYTECKNYGGNSEDRLKQYLDSKNLKINLISHIHHRINEDGSKREHP
jgi:hypothetical protein